MPVVSTPATVVTARDMINNAGKLNRVLGVGVTFTDSEAMSGLNRLNSMLDSWWNERLMVFNIAEDSFTWPAATTSRTIGVGGNVSVTRPVKIHSAYFRDSSNNDYPVQIIEDKATYDSITLKTSASSYPDYLFCDYANPLASLFVWGRPSGSLTCVLKSWRQLQSFVSLDVALALPPGYQEAIEFNLAVRTAALDGASPSPEVKEIAAQSKRILKSINQPVMTSDVDIMGGRRGSILNG